MFIAFIACRPLLKLNWFGESLRILSIALLVQYSIECAKSLPSVPSRHIGMNGKGFSRGLFPFLSNTGFDKLHSVRK